MLLKRTGNEVLHNAARILSRNTKITNFYAGSIARSIIESMKDEFPSLYDYMEDALKMGQLSHAEGEYLDLIGELFSFKRRTFQEIDDESKDFITKPIDDTTYRYEISQRVLAAASSNEMSIRLTALSVNGVRDIITKEYAYGTGSFAILVVTDIGYNPVEVRDQVKEELLKVKGLGTKYDVLIPEEMKVDLRVSVILHSSTNDYQKASIRSAIKTEVEKYIGELTVGQDLIYNDLIFHVRQASEKIQDFQFTRFAVNGEAVLLMNQDVADEERFVPGVIDVI